jgi:myxalamid-type polyketide synthase MxaE and MxaD
MALHAACEVLGPPEAGRPIGVKEIVNLKPIVLHEGLEWTLQAALTVEPDGGARFTVHGRPAAQAGGSESPWISHVTARLVREAAAARASAELLAAARARCTARGEGQAFYAELAKQGNGWGVAFQGVQELWRGEDEAVAHVRVPPSLGEDMAHFRFHPAVSDACGHALVATAQSASGAFVGGGVGEIRFHRSPAGETLWSHARLRRSPEGGRIVHGDVYVYDESGALVSETLDARLWYLDAAEGAALLGAPDAWFHEVSWRPQRLEEAGTRGAAGGTWLVLADRGGFAERVAILRPASAGRTVLVERGDAWSLQGDRATIRAEAADDVQRLLEAMPDVSAIVHIWSLDPGADPIGAGAASLLGILHGIRAARAKPRTWLVTRGTQPVLGAKDCEDPWGAMLWGMGRALAVEHGELWGGLFDLGPASEDAGAAPALLAEIGSGGVEDKLAFRSGQRWVSRLVRQPRRAGSGEFSVRADGTYLVTGGLGGIGLAMAGWLVERGARDLLLIGRTPLGPRAEWGGLDPASPAGRRAAAVKALEAAGASVEVASIDIAREGSLEQCLESRRARGAPPVRGVVHAAGVLQFVALEDQDAASLRDGLAAKVLGAWRLHRLLEREPLDLFVSCASTAALLGSPLLGGYAAGNAFLDALAHYRRARGLSALSVDWGTWAEVGMAVEAGARAGSAMLAGFSTISTALGLDALGRLMASGETQAAVMPVDWAELAEAYPAFATDPFLSELVGHVSVKAAQSGGPSLDALRAASESERPGLIGNYLRHEAARALGMDAEKLDPSTPLSSFGFDSLMAVQLKTRIEAELGVTLAMIEFLKGPSVDELVPSLMAAVTALPVATPPKDAGSWEEGSL